MAKTYAIILAAGKGERMQANVPKQFLKLAGRKVLEHTLCVFQKHARIDEIFLVINEESRLLVEEMLLSGDFPKVTKILGGGATRRESSLAGVRAVPEDNAYVLLHDSVRPFVSSRIIDDMLEALATFQAVDVAIPATDTIIEVDDRNRITNVPPRRYLRRGQTPQGFRADIIKRAHQLAAKETDVIATDDCGLVLRYGLCDIHVVPGEEKNIKITHSEDLFLADKLFQLNTVSMDPQIDLNRLLDRVVVIFGASQGIGAATAYMARAHGARVHGFSRTDNVDVADTEAVERALDKVVDQEGQVNHVVNTAAVLRHGRLLDRDMDDVRREIDINYLGSIHVARSAFKHLIPTKGSLALFTSSAFTRGRPLYSVYSSTKAAVVNLVQALAEESAPKHVRINAINPERTATPMRTRAFGQEDPNQLLTADAVAAATLRTLLSPFSGTVVDVRRNQDMPQEWIR